MDVFAKCCFLLKSDGILVIIINITLQATSEHPCHPFTVLFIESSSLKRKVRALKVGLFAFPHIDLTYRYISIDLTLKKNNSNIMFIVTVYFLLHYHDHYLASQAHHAGLYIEMGQVNRLRLVPIPGGTKIKNAYKGNGIMVELPVVGRTLTI